MSAGFTKGLGTPLNYYYKFDVYAGTMVAALVGGTASSISGGKFANGATTGAMQHLFNALSSLFQDKETAIERQKENVRRKYNIFNDPEGINRGRGYYSGYSLGSYVFEVSGGYKLEWKVSPFAADGYSISSAGFAGGLRVPKNVAAWVVVDHGNLNIQMMQWHSNNAFNNAPIYVMDKVTYEFSVYQFNSRTGEWSCHLNGNTC